MSAATQLSTLYEYLPKVITKFNSRMIEAIKYGTHAMQSLPIEQSLSPIDQNYEYLENDYDVGVGYELDVVNPPEAAFTDEYKNIQTPVAYANLRLSYDQLRRYNADPFSLQMRLMKLQRILMRRINLISYMGDTKYSINALGSATPFEAPDTGFDVSTIAKISETISTAKGQLEADLLYDEYYTSAPLIVMGTPDVEESIIQALDTNQVVNGLTFMNEMLREITGNASSRFIKNPYLGGSYDVNDAGVATITPGSDCMAIYYQHPDLMKLLFSGVETRISPLDTTKGQTFQPIMRNTRLDVKSGAASGAGLIDTDITGVP